MKPRQIPVSRAELQASGHTAKSLTAIALSEALQATRAALTSKLEFVSWESLTAQEKLAANRSETV